MSAVCSRASDPTEDFLHEVRTIPPGRYSVELKALIARFRTAPLPGKLVIVELEPHRRWMIGRLPGGHGEPLELLHDELFEERAAIERRVLEMRLIEHMRGARE